ncbi:MAG TPA: PKD domain-containing protein [Gemmatimonadales bacterium]|nr:PKD domain-containing protein [Gemmatimonadales bacterium]
MNRTHLPKLIPLLAALVAATFLITACGGDDGGNDGTLNVTGNADRFAGPTPLVSRFTAESKNAKGDVIYRWRFDDGTTSEEQNPTHTFKRAGYYTVILDARDESGNNDRQTFLLGAWPPKQWAEAQRTPLTKEGALKAQRVQQRRTDARHVEIRRELRKRAREQIEG